MNILSGSKVQSFLFHKQEISDTVTKIPAVPESLHEYIYLGAGIPIYTLSSQILISVNPPLYAIK